MGTIARRDAVMADHANALGPNCCLNCDLHAGMIVLFFYISWKYKYWKIQVIDICLQFIDSFNYSLKLDLKK